MTRPVSLAERLRDAAAMAVLLSGVLVYAYGHTGLRAMAAGAGPTVRGRTAVEQATIYSNAARAGGALAGVGLIAVGWSFWRYHRRRA